MAVGVNVQQLQVVALLLITSVKAGSKRTPVK